MTYILAALFFSGVLLGAALLLHHLIVQSWDEIGAALRYGRVDSLKAAPRLAQPRLHAGV